MRLITPVSDTVKINDFEQFITIICNWGNLYSKYSEDAWKAIYSYLLKDEEEFGAELFVNPLDIPKVLEEYSSKQQAIDAYGYTNFDEIANFTSVQMLPSGGLIMRTLYCEPNHLSF
jgi:hypothetical protein